MTPGELEYGATAIAGWSVLMAGWMLVGLAEGAWARIRPVLTRDRVRDFVLVMIFVVQIADLALARHQHRCADERIGQLRAQLQDSGIRQGWILERLNGSR